MRFISIINLIIVMMLANSSVNAAPPSTGTDATKPPAFVDVSTSAQDVIYVANFAAAQMGRGSLYQVLSAQKQDMGDLNYRLTLQVVDAHFKFHNYIAVVFVPLDKTKPWSLTYFTPTTR